MADGLPSPDAFGEALVDAARREDAAAWIQLVYQRSARCTPGSDPGIRLGSKRPADARSVRAGARGAGAAARSPAGALASRGARVLRGGADRGHERRGDRRRAPRGRDQRAGPLAGAGRADAARGDRPRQHGARRRPRRWVAVGGARGAQQDRLHLHDGRPNFISLLIFI